MSQIVYTNKINKASDKFEQENGRKPSVEELELETNLDSSKINLALSSINRAMSLDTPFKDEDAGSLLDVLPNDNAENADTSSVQESISKEIEDVLSNLSYRERDVIRMIFGLGMTPMQNEEIANRFGIGCERVRQIQHEALEKIRMNYSDNLRGLL